MTSDGADEEPVGADREPGEADREPGEADREPGEADREPAGADREPAGAGGGPATGDARSPGVELAFQDQDLLPAVAQDADTGEVLMLAYVSQAALERTRETGRAHYYSRSRDELWEKGATSGHTQAIREIRVDCDGDALLYLVEQTGGACHTGYRSCFHRTMDGEVVGEQVFDPEAVYDDG